MTNPSPSAQVDSDGEAFEALADCDACLVESSVVELIAPRGASGVVLERRCRLCLREHRGDALVHPGEALRGERESARRALLRWAQADGDDDAERFVLAHFGGDPLEAVADRLARGDRIETSFDAIAWLFPGVGAVGGGGAKAAPIDTKDTLETGPPRFATGEPKVAWPEVHRQRTSLPPMAIPVTHESIPRNLQPLRVSARALASVMLADGDASASDRAFIERTLASWGHPPIEPADLAVWRPHDLGWPHDSNAVVEAMCRLAYADGQRDATEWRVVREFARSWGVSLEAVERLGAILRAEHTRGWRKAWANLRSVFVR